MDRFETASADAAAITGRRWTTQTPRGAAILVHGLGDHGGRFAWLAERLNRRGFHAVAPDLRGHGMSPGQRGYVADFAELVDDLAATIEYAREEWDLPAVVYAQSMGAIIAGLTLIERRPPVAAAIFSSPAFAPALEPPRWKILVGTIASRVLPRLTLAAHLSAADMSRDLAAVAALEADPLRHDRISARFYFGYLDATRQLEQCLTRIACPVLMMHGDADRVTSCAATRRVAEQYPDRVTLRIWPGAFHELHHDICRTDVAQMAITWIEGQL